MKTSLIHRIGYALLFVATPMLAGAAVIDLSNPLSHSITPDGVYWNFDQGSLGDTTTAAEDQSSNGYNGVLYSGNGHSPVYSAGRFGNGITLVDNSAAAQGPRVSWSGSSHEGDNTALDLDSSFTMGTWMKLNEYNTGSQQKVHLFERGYSTFADATNKNNFVSFYLQKWGVDTWSPTLWLGDGERVVTLAPVVADRTVAFNDLEWHHIGLTLLSTEEGIEVQFYVDGIALGEVIKSDFSLAAVTNDSDRIFTLGERNSSSYQGQVNAIFDDAFVTSGVHSFVIPEPATTASILLFGVLAGWILHKKRR